MSCYLKKIKKKKGEDVWLSHTCEKAKNIINNQWG